MSPVERYILLLILKELRKVTQAQDNANAALAGLESSLTAAMALLDQLLAAVQAAAGAANADPAFQALADKLTADKAALDAKVAADTPKA